MNQLNLNDEELDCLDSYLKDYTPLDEEDAPLLGVIKKVKTLLTQLEQN